MRNSLRKVLRNTLLLVTQSVLSLYARICVARLNNKEEALRARQPRDIVAMEVRSALLVADGGRGGVFDATDAYKFLAAHSTPTLLGIADLLGISNAQSLVLHARLACPHENTIITMRGDERFELSITPEVAHYVYP